VFELFSFLAPMKLFSLMVKPLVRLILGLVAVPLSKVLLHRVVRGKELNEELEKDITEWILGSVLLLVATANMESLWFGWVPLEFREEKVWLVGLRLLLAIGVIEKMPDQALFAIIHPGPPPLRLQRGRFIGGVLEYLPRFFLGLLCQHFNRSSPVFAILTVFLEGQVGWICYGLAITNYLIIGLVSSKDKALNVLQKFDEAVAHRRDELVEELQSSPGELTPTQRVAAAEQAGPFPGSVEPRPEPRESPANGHST
jgi:hypothetical protein